MRTEAELEEILIKRRDYYIDVGRKNMLFDMIEAWNALVRETNAPIVSTEGQHFMAEWHRWIQKQLSDLNTEYSKESVDATRYTHESRLRYGRTV